MTLHILVLRAVREQVMGRAAKKWRNLLIGSFKRTVMHRLDKMTNAGETFDWLNTTRSFRQGHPCELARHLAYLAPLLS